MSAMGLSPDLSPHKARKRVREGKRERGRIRDRSGALRQGQWQDGISGEESRGLELLNDIIDKACSANLFTQTTQWITHKNMFLSMHTHTELRNARCDLYVQCYAWYHIWSTHKHTHTVWIFHLTCYKAQRHEKGMNGLTHMDVKWCRC